MFPGLMPSKGKFAIPNGFSPPPQREPTPELEEESESDFEASTAAAIHEWESIRQAFDVFQSRLGPDFAPMGADLAFPEPTPFGGPALMYRTFSIAGIWMNFYMGLVTLHRAHPSMPPVAMIAAGMAAPKTALYAYLIARIAAGLHEDTQTVTAVSTLVGAAFIESSFCLFVAGIQFRETPQRHWLIRRMHDIARLTGWQSARQIADGCESAWTKAAAMGRGPPYERPPGLGELFPSSIWLRPRRLDRKFRELKAVEKAGGAPESGLAGTTGDTEEVGGLGGETRLVLARTEQTHFALGLLSVERDFETLELSEAA